MKRIYVVVVFLAMLVLAGCRTITMSNLQSIPCGDRSQAQMLDAVERAVETFSPPDDPKDNKLGARYRVDWRTNDSITVSATMKNHYVYFRYDFKDHNLVPTVVSSYNMLQSGDSIHRNAVRLINALAPGIENAVYSQSQNIKK